MVYLIVKSAIMAKVVLVKAESVVVVKERLNLKGDECIVGSLTPADIFVLEHADFAVIEV